MDLLKHLLTNLETWDLSSFKDFLIKYTSSDVSAARKEQLKVAFDLQKFGIPECQPVCDEYSREALLIELFQDSIEFALNEGFSCNELFHFLIIHLRTLTTLASQSHTGPETPSTLMANFRSSVLQYSDKLIHDHLLCTVSYIRDTVFRHYRLYQYLLMEEQPLDVTAVKLEVPQPIETLPLTGAIQEQEWVKSQHIAELETKQRREREVFKEACELAAQEERSNLQSVYESELARIGEQAEMSEDDVRCMVESLTAAHLQSAKLALSHTLNAQAMSLEMKTEQLELLSPKHALATKEE